MVIDIEDLLDSSDIQLDNDHKWGFEIRMVNTVAFCGKFLVLTEVNAKSSLHYHKTKSEMFVVLKGKLELESGCPNNLMVTCLKAGQKILILSGIIHRFKAVEPTIVLEVSTHHEDSDTYRVEDSQYLEVSEDG